MNERIIWLGLYEHRYGTDIAAYATEAAAEAGREALARQWWDDHLPDEPMPACDVADAYLEAMSEQEWFEIRPVPLL